MAEPEWHEMGRVADLEQKPLQSLTVAGHPVALSFQDGTFGAIAGHCLHAGGPMGEGTLRGEYVVCPWHGWRFNRCDGKARPGFAAALPAYALKEENGTLFISFHAATPAQRPGHEPHPLTRPVERAPGGPRMVGISTTAMDAEAPRYSTSDDLLRVALEHARTGLGCETRLIKLNELNFKHCEGYYSKAAGACTWPCTLTQMDDEDQLDQVYEALVFWADIVLVATPIRWGAASSLYFKMAERMNCIQNQVTTHNRILIQRKTAAFIITGGQDNIQGVAGQMLTFFGELGFLFPQFPFLAHSRGWSAEDMENNVRHVRTSEELRMGARELAARTVAAAKAVIPSPDR